MAIGFERRQASLIGAGDLPQARASGAAPDLSGLGRAGLAIVNNAVRKQEEAQAESERRNAITDRIKGMEKGALEAPTFVGKDETGRAVTFNLPNGTAEYQVGYLEGFNSVQDGKFRQAMEARYNEIQSKVTLGEIQPGDASRLMQSYLEGALEKAPGHLRGSWSEAGQTEIAQRSGLMTAQRAAQDADLLEQDLKAQTLRDAQEAVSIASAGGDTTSVLARVDQRIDSLVKLRKLGPEQAVIQKQAIRENVAGQAFVNRLNSAIARGEALPEDIERLGTAIETNTTGVSAVVRRGVEVSPTGEKAYTDEAYNSDDVFANIKDEKVRQEMGLKLRQMAQEYKAAAGARAEDQQYLAQLQFLNGPQGRTAVLPSTLRDKADLHMANVLAQGDVLADPNLRKAVRDHLAATKYVPKALAATLQTAAASGDPAMMENALSLYREIVYLRSNYGDTVGDTLRETIPSDVRDLMEGLDEGYRLGFSTQELANNMRTARGNTEFGVGNLIGEYNTKVKGDAVDGDGFWKDYRAAFPNALASDPEAKEAFKTAYRQNMILLRDPTVAFAKSVEMVTKKYRPSEVLESGVESGSFTLENPDGYEPKQVGRLWGAPPEARHEWVNNTIGEDILTAAADGTLMPLMDSDGNEVPVSELVTAGSTDLGSAGGVLDFLTKPWGETMNANWLGKTGKLVPVPGSNPDAPEYMVRMRSKEGKDLGIVMVEKDGVVQPLTVNPHFEREQASLKFQSNKMLETGTQAAKDRFLELQDRVLNQLTPAQQGAYDGKIPLEDYLQQTAPEMAKQYLLDRKQIDEGLDGLRDTYEKATGTKVPRTKVDQLTLVQPRAAGFDVAAAAAAVVDSVVPDGTSGTFLLRIAAAESNFGMAGGTYRLRGDKGMTQVNTGSGFKEVQRQIAKGEGRVYAAARALQDQLGLDLMNLRPDDLDKPLVAMAVARLYIEAVGRPVPQDLEGQARWWKRHYNTHLGTGTVAGFVKSGGKVPDSWRTAALEEG